MSDQKPSNQMTYTAPPEVVSLVERFTEQRAAYRAGKYNETQLRRDFLDPLFEALGWDMTNRKNYSERYREVIHEVSVEVEGQAKAADYAFQSGGNTHFFLEAKKPSVNIETNPEPAFQIRRYAWSAKLPVSIVSDFEQMAVYDCRTKPVHGDAVHLGRTELFFYTDYVDQWDKLYRLFSYQAVHQGSLDKYAVSIKGKRGTADVDDTFLEEMERWREALARNIALRNPSLTQREINSAVQTTIDRIVFLRICEDRGIEPEEGLRNATDGIDVYGDLMALFKKADKKYNSGLFHFDTEKGQSSYADTLTPHIKIDDKVLKDILANLYYPKSPYAFKYISADILGQVYERFLGKVITLSAGHRASVTEKPEVRKAGGVYYTPTYIVDYIVKNTVGELLKEKDPEILKTTPLRVLDPACGSGSFLLGAYQYLLDWYLDWYVQHEPGKWAKGKNPPIFETRDGWQLTMEKKKDILTRHIFGVDIDTQAVEVTKLSLLLKVVEKPEQLSFLTERILPDLGKNIQCGNSLIGPDYYENQQLTMFDDEERYRVNAFDWQSAFPQVFQNGGFDAVIGNPPYIRSQSLGVEQRNYYKNIYVSALGTYDIYVLFVEKSIKLINKYGKCGFILPNKFFTTDYGEGLRKLLAARKNIEQIVDFEDSQVFTSAGTYTNILILSNTHLSEILYTRLGDVFKKTGTIGLKDALSNSNIIFTPIQITEDGSRWTLASGISGSVLINLNKKYPPFQTIHTHIFQGLKTSADKIYLIQIIEQNNRESVVKNLLGETFIIETDILRPVVKGEDVRRYQTNISNWLYIIYPYKIVTNEKVIIIDQNEMKSKFPKAWTYLINHKKILGDRDKGIWEKRVDWYAYARSQNIGTFIGQKFLVPYMTVRLKTDFDEIGNLFFVNITTGGYGLRINTSENNKYIFGLLNSKLLDHCIKQMTNRFRGGYYAINKQALERLPYRAINFSDQTDVSHHDHMVALVESMLALHKQSAAARLPDEKERLAREIQSTDREIDKLVYELYGLTEEEIKIVEESYQ